MTEYEEKIMKQSDRERRGEGREGEGETEKEKEGERQRGRRREKRGMSDGKTQTKYQNRCGREEEGRVEKSGDVFSMLISISDIHIC